MQTRRAKNWEITNLSISKKHDNALGRWNVGGCCKSYKKAYKWREGSNDSGIYSFSVSQNNRTWCYALRFRGSNESPTKSVVQSKICRQPVVVDVFHERLQNIKPPGFVQRRPRSIKKHSKYWKASELKNFFYFSLNFGRSYDKRLFWKF